MNTRNNKHLEAFKNTVVSVVSSNTNTFRFYVHIIMYNALVLLY